MRPLLIRGMHGLGDNLHQRALLRQLMQRHDVWLESSWIAPYHDLIAQGLKVVHKHTSLRTQAKNAKREAAGFSKVRAPAGARSMQVWYRPDEVRRHGGVLAAMCANTGCDYADADFRLPIPLTWEAKAARLLEDLRATKPIMLYRPLVERREWSGCAARNPDHAAYAALFKAVRDDFFVISVADLAPNMEWIVGERVEADASFHRGQLEFEVLAALFARASLVMCSPGFAAVLAQAVGTPVACVFGGYERAYSFSGGARFSPYLGIEPINPVDDFHHDTRCDKRIDLGTAIPRLRAFAAEAAGRTAVAA